MKSAANKSYNSALAKALFGLNHPKVAGLYSQSRLLGITSWNGHLTVKWHSCCRGVAWKHSQGAVTKWEQDKQWELSSPCISTLSSERAEILALCPVCWASPTMLFSFFPVLFQLCIAVRWERSQLLPTSLGLKQQQRHNMLSVLPSTQTKVKLCRSQLENTVKKMQESPMIEPGGG